jgi:hypothetical protein
VAPAKTVSPRPDIWLLPLIGLLVLALTSALSTPSTQAVAPAPLPIDGGDTAWMLTATALVLLMTPGLSFFYGGMVEKPKNGSCGPENAASTRNHFGF